MPRRGSMPQRRRLTPVIAAMPPHAVFVNVGRGATVDTDALVDGIRREFEPGLCILFGTEGTA